MIYLLIQITSAEPGDTPVALYNLELIPDTITGGSAIGCSLRTSEAIGSVLHNIKLVGETVNNGN